MPSEDQIFRRLDDMEPTEAVKARVNMGKSAEHEADMKAWDFEDDPEMDVAGSEKSQAAG